MKNRVVLIRWVILLPALVFAFFVAHFVYQLIFPMIQAHLGISGDDLHGMSIMDQEVVFGPYGEGIFAFFLVLTCYTVIPRAKIIVSLAILSLGVLLSTGVISLTLGKTGGGLLALLFAIIIRRMIDYIRQSKRWQTSG